MVIVGYSEPSTAVKAAAALRGNWSFTRGTSCRAVLPEASTPYGFGVPGCTFCLSPRFSRSSATASDLLALGSPPL